MLIFQSSFSSHTEDIERLCKKYVVSFIFLFGQRYLETAAFVHTALYLNITAVRRHYRLYDSESYSRTSRKAVARLVRAVKPLENKWRLITRYAYAVILHREERGINLV
jgi:hypothetical protein